MKHLSILLAATLGGSILTGCGDSATGGKASTNADGSVRGDAALADASTGPGTDAVSPGSDAAAAGGTTPDAHGQTGGTPADGSTAKPDGNPRADGANPPPDTDAATPPTDAAVPPGPDGAVPPGPDGAAPPPPRDAFIPPPPCAAPPASDGDLCPLADGVLGQCTNGDCLMAADPAEPGGPAGIEASGELDLPGGLFGVQIPLHIYLPADDGPHPVVILIHGFQLDAGLYASYGQHLATWGYVAILPQMPGGLIGGPTHRDLKDYTIALMDYVGQTGADPAGPFAGKADPGVIGLSGHSMGGKISLLTASEDARPQAVFGIDPVDAAGGPFSMPDDNFPSVTPERMGQIAVPVGLLGETTNATCDGFGCQACAPAADNFQQYYEFAESPALRVEVVGANHMSFLDNPNCGLFCAVCSPGTDNPETSRQLAQRSMTAFFNVYLKHQEQYRSYLTGPGIQSDVALGLVVTEHKNGL